MRAAEALYREMVSFGLSVEARDGMLFVSPTEQITDALRAKIRITKHDLLALLSRPANAPAPPRTWLVTPAAGDPFSLSRTPRGTLAEIEADYPGALVEPEPEPPIGPALHPDDLGLAHAYLRHIGETDLATGQEWIDGLARDPERLRQMYAEAVRLGIATFDPAPEQPVEVRPHGAVCARCAAFEPSPINPKGGMGRCLTDAPASRKAGSLWPWPDAEVRCGQFAPETTTTSQPTAGTRP